MKIKRTNFEGSWDDICSFCGEIQENHKQIMHDHEGTRYEHRMPCIQEKKSIRKIRS